MANEALTEQRMQILSGVVSTLLSDLKAGTGDKDRRRQVEEWMRTLAEKYPEFKIETGLRVYYLAEAQHAQIEPLHPTNFKLVYLGNLSDMRGHSHPPMNAWILGALLALFGDIREVPFHAAYIVFSLVAALAMWSLARRFSPQQLWATMLFLATPAFVIAILREGS